MYSLQFLGTGSFFTTENYHSNVVIWNDAFPEDKLLIDCGSDIKYSLRDANISHREIKDVFISHFHADHVGGLEWLGFATYFDSVCKKPKLHCSEWGVGGLWDYTLSGGMRNLNGKRMSIGDYFVPQKMNFDFNGAYVSPINLVHLNNGVHDCSSTGCFMNFSEEIVFFTSDVSFDLSKSRLEECYAVSDIIFHECETYQVESGVHSHYNKLRELPDEVKNKMWLYHYNDGELPDAVRDGFRGFVKKGQIFQFE